MHPMHIFTGLFGLAVMFGAVTMVAKQPKHTNALLAAGSDTISGVTKALEGR